MPNFFFERETYCCTLDATVADGNTSALLINAPLNRARSFAQATIAHNRKGCPLVTMGRLLRVESESAFALRTAADAAAKAEAAAALPGEARAEAADDEDDHSSSSGGGGSVGGVALKEQRHLVFAQWLVDTYGHAALASGSGVCAKRAQRGRALNL